MNRRYYFGVRKNTVPIYGQISLVSPVIVFLSRAVRKKRFSGIAKGIDLCQPAQFAQADMGRYISLS